MEHENSKKNCKSCKSDKGVKNTQRYIFIFGGLTFLLTIYGLYSIVRDITTLF